MDTNFFFALVLIIILMIMILEWNEAFTLLILGFLAIMVAVKTDDLFNITNLSYGGWGQMIQLIYVFLGIFAFAKTFWANPMFMEYRERLRLSRKERQ